MNDSTSDTDLPTRLLEAALRYAEMGYPVFPCQPGGKIPFEHTHGFKDATTNAAQIRRWWKKWPDANVAISTAGMVVIDIDGPDNLWPNDERGEDLAACGAQSVTPRGGQHYWFRQPEGKSWRNTESRLAPKVDTRADGGYALVSPSVVNGSSYQWAEGCELNVPPSRLGEPPAWLIAELDALKKKKRKENPATPPKERKAEKPFTTITPSEEPARAWALAALEGECRKVASAVPGTRNGTLNTCAFTVGGHVGAGNLNFEEAEEALFQAAKEAGCDDDRKDRDTIRRALEAGMGSPLHPPEPNTAHEEAEVDLSGILGKGKADCKAGNKWPTPIPLNMVPAAAKFPLDALPQNLEHLACLVSRVMNCPVDYPAVIALSLVGGAIGNSVHIQFTSTFRHPAMLFAAYVGLPGSCKTPPLSLLRKPFDDVQAEYKRNHEKEMDDFNNLGESEKAFAEMPRLKRISTSKATMEGVEAILALNPRGLMLIRSELAGMVSGLGQYKRGGGDDKQVLLSIWDGDDLLTDRRSDAVNQRTQLVRKAFMGIVGSLQPDVLPFLRGDAEPRARKINDGFIDRWLVSYPEPIPARGWLDEGEDVPENLLTWWSDKICALLEIPMCEDNGRMGGPGGPWFIAGSGGPPGPHYVRLTPDAFKVFQEFTQANADRINDPEGATVLNGFLAKMPIHLARLTLILHACRGDEPPTLNDLLEPVEAETMRKAVRLADYFREHAARVYAVMGRDVSTDDAALIARVILQERWCKFTKSELNRKVKNRGQFKKVADLDAPLALLEKHNFISPEQTKPGGKASPAYNVNPNLEPAHLLPPG